MNRALADVIDFWRTLPNTDYRYRALPSSGDLISVCVWSCTCVWVCAPAVVVHLRRRRTC